MSTDALREYTMDFELDDDQKLFRSTVREFVDREIRPVAHDWEAEGRYPTEIVETMRQLGLFGITIPQKYGGTGLGLVNMAIVAEEISRGWMGISGIIGSHLFASRMIADHGTDEQKARYLPDLATGKRRTAIALTEPDAGTDLQGIKTRAVREGDTYVVNGTKFWITNARYADPLPVLVKTDPGADPAHRGMSILLVDKGTAGVEVSRDIPKLGYKGTESAEVVLSDARVPAANLLGGVEGRGFKQVMSGLDVGRVNVAARSVGIAQEAYDQALAYSKEREAFGQPIAEFQAIQMKLAEMATRVQAARLLTWWAASRGDTGSRIDTEAAMAKYYASEAALTNALESMRVHGGAGYSTDLDIERLYRDAPLMAIGEGTSDVQKIVMARGLIEGRTVID